MSEYSRQTADLIWSKLFSNDNGLKTKEDEINAIESVIIQTFQEQRLIGRNQILNHFEIEVNNLKC